jgi:hypothetical protein
VDDGQAGKKTRYNNFIFCPLWRPATAKGLTTETAAILMGYNDVWKLFEDLVLRLALLPCHQALLVYRVPWDIHPHAQTPLLLGLARTPVIVAANIRIAIAQTTIVITT